MTPHPLPQKAPGKAATAPANERHQEDQNQISNSGSFNLAKGHHEFAEIKEYHSIDLAGTRSTVYYRSIKIVGLHVAYITHFALV